ncbi:hypothetical protein, partial [Sinomonas sp. G460-2]|uniref:hypothetical protein n=1 Tax=Sinomonas sp. G460-2 TaxID=3393464 RepID=UPI0039EFAF28
TRDRAENPTPSNPIQAETQPQGARESTRTRQTAIKKKWHQIQTWHAIEFSNNRPNRNNRKPPASPLRNEVQTYQIIIAASNSLSGFIGRIMVRPTTAERAA